MELVYIGKIVKPHGIKGEIRIKSNIDYKEEVFKIGNQILIEDKEYKIKTYRRHKDYEMITLEGYNNINDILSLLKKKVYINRTYLDKKIVLDSDLLNYKVSINKEIGTIKEIFLASKTNKIIRININNKEVLIPYNKEFIEKIDQENKIIYIKLIDGMML